LGRGRKKKRRHTQKLPQPEVRKLKKRKGKKRPILKLLVERIGRGTNKNYRQRPMKRDWDSRRHAFVVGEVRKKKEGKETTHIRKGGGKLKKEILLKRD